MALGSTLLCLRQPGACGSLSVWLSARIGVCPIPGVTAGKVPFKQAFLHLALFVG